MNCMNKVKIGIYKHYKDKYYEVIGEAMHTETCKTLVLYCNLNNRDMIYARPVDMFYQNVLVDNALIPRFKYIRKYR